MTEAQTHSGRLEPIQPKRHLRPPALAGVLCLAVVLGVGCGTSGDDGDSQTAPTAQAQSDGVTASTLAGDPEADDQDGQADDVESDVGDGDGGGDGADGRDGEDGEGDEDDAVGDGDLGSVTGADASPDLPATAPETYWAVRADSYDLIQVEARTGRILTNLGGWDLLGDPDDAEIVQALQTVQVSPDGSLFLDDCCEPAFGTIYQLQPGERFDQESSLRLTGLNPHVSPSGELLMYSFGGSLQITVADFSQFRDEGWPQLGQPDSIDGIGYVPLAWIDDRTIAVRVTGPDIDGAEQIRIYELTDNQTTEQNVIERQEARRDAPERLFVSAATRSDGMLVVAGLRPTAEQLETGAPLGRSGDLVAEVIDPSNGELVSEFDLPDRIGGLDYDQDGRFLLAADDDGTLRWYGGGGSGVLADNIIHATWH